MNRIRPTVLRTRLSASEAVRLFAKYCSFFSATVSRAFDVSCLPDVKANPGHLTGGGGRGLVLVHMFMDEVTFNAAGNEITLVKHACSGE